MEAAILQCDSDDSGHIDRDPALVVLIELREGCISAVEILTKAVSHKVCREGNDRRRPSVEAENFVREIDDCKESAGPGGDAVPPIG